jgi:integrase
MSLIEVKENFPGTVGLCIEAYFKFEVSTAKSSRKLQKRDLNLFHEFILAECPNEKRPQHKSHRPYRNRAIVYTLIEPGMRRAAATKLDLKDVDFKRRTLKIEEKGGAVHGYKITREGLAAIQDYIEKARGPDFGKDPKDLGFGEVRVLGAGQRGRRVQQANSPLGKKVHKCLFHQFTFFTQILLSPPKKRFN